ncbi:MAG: hypothetical protein Kow0059_00270 [Candidatus Sumerlaeia bacterium]
MPQPGDQLGEALIKEGLLTEHQLQHALQIQQDSVERKRLGQILVEFGYITKRQLRDISRKYSFRQQIGELLVDSGFITDEQLVRALEEQQATRRPLGEILIEKEWVTEEQFARAVAEQLDYPYILPDKRLVDRTLLQQFSAPFLRQYCILPMFKSPDATTIVVPDPFDRHVLRMIDTTVRGPVELAVGPKSVIQRVLGEVLDERTLLSKGTTTSADEVISSSSFQRYDLDNVQPAASSATQVISIVDYLLINALNQRASDIHIEAMYNKIRVRHRVDGKLVYETDLPKGLAEAVIRRIKVMAKIDPTDSSDILDGHIYVKHQGNNVDLRVSVFPTVLGTSITIRALSKEIGLKSLGDLGMLPRGLTVLKRILDTPSGMILFAGPTGAGKTTSLYACLNYLNHDDLKICTVETPVEYSIEGVAQSQLRPHEKGSITDKIKAMMHQDPDVIVLGEINDADSAEAAVQAALSGHKVFSTIHTEDSFGAIMRLMDMGLHTFLLSNTGIASIAQRLVRKICVHCKTPFTPERQIFKQFNLKDIDPDTLEFVRGMGCMTCRQTGFFGRTGLFEILTMSDEIRNAFLDSKNASHIRRLAQQSKNFLSLREAGFIKALQGDTTLDEVLSVLSYSEQQAFVGMSLTQSDIRFWMGLDDTRS